MVTRKSATAEVIAATQSVLLELANILERFWDAVVVVGGMVPLLGIPQDIAPHPGTVDIDLALDHRKMRRGGYLSIQEILIRNLYQQDKKKPFRYYRTVTINERSITVPVDFLTGEEHGTDSDCAFEEVEEVLVLKLQGCEVAFLDHENRRIHGARPDGGLDEAEIHIAKIPQSIAMKGFALSRSEAKDPFDIYYMTKYYPGGISALVAKFQPFLADPMVKDALSRIREKFRSPDHIGPKQVADEMDDEERIVDNRRDAFEQVNALLVGLGIP